MNTTNLRLTRPLIGKLLLAMRPGPLTHEQANARYGFVTLETFRSMHQEGWVMPCLNEDGEHAWRLTPAGRAVCPSARELAKPLGFTSDKQARIYAPQP